MKKFIGLFVLVVFTTTIFAQRRNIGIVNKENLKPQIVTDKVITYKIKLNYFAVSEATRNKIDNNDCRKIFGSVSIKLFELNDQNEPVREITSIENNGDLFSADSRHTRSISKSYYEEFVENPSNLQIKSLSYNIPERLLANKKVRMEVKYDLVTGHKDNDIASFDRLTTGNNTENYILDNAPSRKEVIQTITTGSYAGSHSDDNHKIWIYFSFKKL